ncbi:hypothetical protein L226DRAFT_108363 [Lentinus tigrinus ALCF2SS1-7]|nr:hypothetical protein L226DRAFT_108363 [Lentinus tigrinus ALCF2SS1-7]
MATEDVLTNPEVPIPATQPDDVAAVAASVRKLQEAIRIPRMKVRVASSRTSARRTRPMPAPYSRPSPSSSSSSPSSPASSPASSNSNTPLTESPLPLTCPLPDCPSPSKTYSRRADLERHILTAGTHLLPSDAWACCGLPLAIARARRLPQSVLDQPPREYYGVRMVGGCGRENSRKDALGRHLNRREGRCWGEREGEWLVGNRFKEVWKAQMEAVVERDVQMLEAVDSGSGKARRSARGARR